MAYDLSELVFRANTTELDKAVKMIDVLVKDFSKLSAASLAAAKVESQRDEILSRINKNQAAARKDTAAALNIETKSLIAADEADQRREKSIQKTTAATEKAAKATEKNVSILERQKDILEFQTEGYSKGQSGILAFGKAAGLAGDQMKELQNVLETQRKLMGTDPFDKSISGLKSLQNEYRELQVAVGQYNDGSNLTSKQTRELARDQERLIERLKQQKKSTQEVDTALKAHTEGYVDLAGKVNTLRQQEDAVIKQRMDLVKATNYVTTADEKMAAALGTVNAGLAKSGTDLLVKYESSLRKSGLAQEVVTAKLTTYRTQLQQVQALEEKRQANNLTRAISPQLTDIAVSLYSGQAPLTVLLQQGGQLADIFKLSGVEAGNLGKLMKESFYGMIPVIKEVGAALGGLVVGVFQDLGKYALNTVGGITGIAAAMDKLKNVIASGGEANFKYIGTLNKLEKAFSAVAGVGILALIAAIAATSVAMYKLNSAQNDLSTNILQSGAALGMTTKQAAAYAISLDSIGVGSLAATKALSAFAEAGVKRTSELGNAIKSAVEVQKTLGVSVEDTAKEYAKLQDKPLETLTEYATRTGQITKETLNLVDAKIEEGKKTEAVAIATQAFDEAQLRMSKEKIDSLDSMSRLWVDIKKGISDATQEVYNLGTSSVIVDAFKKVWETIAVVVSEVWFVIKGVGTEIGGIASQIAAVLTGDFAAARSIGEQMKLDADAAAKSQDQLIQKILNRSSTETKAFETSKGQNSTYAKWRQDNAKALEKEDSKKDRLAEKERQLQQDVIDGIITETEKTKTLAGWKRVIGEDKKTIDPAAKQRIRDLETETDLINKGEGYTKSYNNEIDALNRLRAAGVITEEKYLAATLALEESQPYAVKMYKEQNDARELENKLMGKSIDLGAEYYKNLTQIGNYLAKGIYSPEQAQGLIDALNATTPLEKKRLALMEKQRDEALKLTNSYELQRDALTGSSEKLDQQYSLLGLSSKQQELITIEYEKQNKLNAAAVALKKQEFEIDRKLAKNDLSPEQAAELRLDVEKNYAEQVRQINSETALKYAQDLDREIKGVREGISAAIADALFEGGKVGAQKIRDVIKSYLKTKFTVWIDAQLSSITGSLFGNSTAGGLASAATGGNSLLSAASNLNSLYGAISQFFTGSTAGASAASLFAANSVGTVGGDALGTLISANGGWAGVSTAATGTASASAGAGAAGGASSALGSIPIVGWIAAGMLAANSLYDKGYTADSMDSNFANISGFGRVEMNLNKLLTKIGVGDKFANILTGAPLVAWANSFVTGETRTGGQYDTTSGLLAKPSGGEIAGSAVQQAQAATVDGINSLFKTIGSATTVAYYNSGLESSRKGKGFTYAGGTLSTGQNFGEGFGTGYMNNRGSKTPEEALAEYQTELQQSVVKALQVATDIPQTIKSLVSGVNADSLDSAGVTAILEQIYAVVAAVKAFGETVVNLPFENLKNLSFDATSSLITLAGGLDTLASKISTYYDTFYSASEKATSSSKAVGAVISSLGYLDADFSKSSDWLIEYYKNLVNSQDLATESGRNTYNSLLDLSSSFYSVVTALAEVKKQLTSDAFDRLQTSVDAQKALIADQETTLNTSIATLQSLFDLLGNSIDTLYDQVSSTASMKYAEARNVISTDFNTVTSGGTVSDTTGLTDAISAAMSGLSASDFATKQEYDKERLTLAAELTGLQDSTGKQLTTAQSTLAELEAQSEALDATLVYWEQQVAIANGTYLATLSVAQAIANLQIAMTGVTPPAYASGGNYQGGIALVGEKGPELINFNRPGYVSTASQTSSILSNSGDDSRITSLEVNQSAMLSTLRKIESNTDKSRKVLERVSNSSSGGDAFATIVTT